MGRSAQYSCAVVRGSGTGGKSVNLSLATTERETLLFRVSRFLHKPWREKVRSIAFRWVRAFPGAMWPVRLPSGGWWLAQNDDLSACLLQGQ
jgi:hypothetical protein